MYSIQIRTSAKLQDFFKRYPGIYDGAVKKAVNRSLDLLQRSSFLKAPYKTGVLKREIKQLYDNKKLVAGTDLSKPYARIQDLGGKAGRNHSVTIRPKHYFYRNAEEQKGKVLNEFVRSFKEVFAKM